MHRERTPHSRSHCMSFVRYGANLTKPYHCISLSFRPVEELLATGYRLLTTDYFATDLLHGLGRQEGVLYFLILQLASYSFDNFEGAGVC